MNGDSYSRGRIDQHPSPSLHQDLTMQGEGSRHSSSRDHQSSRGDRGDRDRDDRRDRDRGERTERSERNRRRSRSPDYRSGRGSRRDGAGAGGALNGAAAGVDADSYSSSRSHRDREREDRYTGRERRDRDPWGAGDRDRGDRQDRDRGDRGERGDRERGGRRRDDDDRQEARPRRRDRDRDREGGERGDRADRGERGERGDRGDRRGGGGDRDRRRASASPSAKKREPTPDLTDVVSVLERKRRLTQWDMKPPGYESVTAEQAKLSGMFPLPGAPRQLQQQPVDPGKLQAFIAQAPAPAQASTSLLKPNNSRQARRLHVTNFTPQTTTEESLVAFFNLQLNGLNVIEGTDPCVQAQISNSKTFAFLEFREASDATVALAMDGISMESGDSHNGGDSQNGQNGQNGQAVKGLSINRPKDYIVPALADTSIYQAGVVSQVVVDSPNKISITNIPPYLTDEQVTELLVAFGELRAFVLVKDRGTEESRGIAFCEYAEAASTEIAVQGLNCMDLGDRKLRVQKASVGITQVTGIEMGVNAMSMLAGTVALDNSDASPVVQLLNMVTADELVDNDDYEDILEDVKEECSKYGAVASLKVPRPSGGSRQVAGVGKIYVKFDTAETATKALKALAGRKFSDRTVVATYFPEENYEVDAW
ncbi:splicing factor u2af large subunit [Ophiostoma piceae UAMH 11346]|uniref:Splicing factor u2af large subunit n=1 Tax=Ophiostoma piceae (strain UAMH 11346) TaxID=1262450 RepID=S3C8G0_OPHP1|nr:splicing factor u2af large subunit [Ophiostoma piceae UAMH 11346]